MAPYDDPNGEKETQVDTMTSGCGDSEQMMMPNNDDDVSIASDADSITMFEQDDFEQETWSSVVTPTSIVGILAGVGLFSIMNPLVFVSLAATTLGAYHVVSHAHELVLEEYELWKNGSTTTGICRSSAYDGKLQEGAQQSSVKESSPQRPVKQDSLRSAVESSPTSTIIAPTTTFETIKSSDDEETTYSNVLTQRFPPLEDEILTNQTFEGLNAIEFFNVFLKDDAPFSFQEFQLKRGDFDIKYGPWTPSTNKDVISFSKMQHLQRTISFKTLTKSFFGPPHATCTKHQEVYMNKRILIMETKVTLEGVPFCDRFYVQERWIMQAPKSTTTDNKVARLSIYSQVFFLGPCAFEQQIHSKSRSTLQEVIASWSTMAQEALAITVRHKMERENNTASLYHVKSECSIEVARSDSSGKSFVVGEDENEPPLSFPMVVETAPRSSKKQQPLQSLKRSVLSRMSLKKMNQA